MSGVDVGKRPHMSAACESNADLVPGFRPITWVQDYAARMSPGLLTQLLHDSVPALSAVEWRLTDVREGYAVSELPLNVASTNQHGTHQATLLALAADYTGGTALGSIMRGVPGIGVHPQPDDNGMALWLVSIEMKYQQPSAAPLRVTAEVAPERWERIRKRYLAGQTVLESLTVRFEADDETVATGQYGYFMKQASMLAPTSIGAKPTPLFAHRQKASARLIAGVRALESESKTPLIKDAWASAVAGPHGRLLADRFTRLLPQLQPMVAARSADIDRLVLDSLGIGLRQVVLIGAGLDMRPFRLLTGRSDVRVFELDLPHMIEERSRVLSRLHDLPAISRTPVAFDLRLQALDQVLASTGTFDPQRPTLFVLEGVSMYHSTQHNNALLRNVRRAMQNESSVLWLDIVRQAVIDRTTGFDSATQFVDSMQRLGEPFIFGVDDPEQFLTTHDFRTLRTVSSNVYNDADADPLYRFYDFWHLGPRCGENACARTT